MKIEIYKAVDHPTIEDVEKLLIEKLGDKYEYKLKKEAGLAGKMMGGAGSDQITVIKNAYHRTVVGIERTSSSSAAVPKFTTINFSEATLAGWLGFLHNQVGFIGRIIIRLIYGSDSEVYDDVRNTIKDNMNIEVEVHEAGLGALFKKKKKEETVEA
ncbi:hypothetical protein M4I21_05070 [Cellulophaga sp. 20_2_10]|uniref:hypothetical protein n=1 Tax=Cellulophaga sp. 20_2_10 TaxID=2942476 RepID=UPI00201AEFCF|nr:hypothetical protein [Cellulophaga sp. 20_2_10]MCL5245169.1 hypothetical protein [Cellulophaga sp. 20_2_10]